MCAGTYGMKLLGIDEPTAIEEQLLHKNEILRPGFVRLSFDFHMDDDEVNFIIEAVAFEVCLYKAL